MSVSMLRCSFRPGDDLSSLLFANCSSGPLGSCLQGRCPATETDKTETDIFHKTERQRRIALLPFLWIRWSCGELGNVFEEVFSVGSLGSFFKPEIFLLNPLSGCLTWETTDTFGSVSAKQSDFMSPEVGIGSGALHASLDAVAQAGDELPMLQLVLAKDVGSFPLLPVAIWTLDVVFFIEITVLWCSCDPGMPCP